MADSLALSGNFEGVAHWAEKYQRNNKRSGLKNLRCFPYCLDEHRVKGFCGRPVTYTISGNVSRKSCWAWAEFRKVDDLGDIDVGTVLTRDEISAKERNRKDCNRPWYVGEVDSESGNRDDERMSFKFNNQKKGWNYGWAANKHTCNAEHCFQVYMFIEHEADQFVCISRSQSPKFKLFCRRRPAALSISQSSTASDLGSDAVPSPRFDELNPSSGGFPSPLSAIGEQHHHDQSLRARIAHHEMATLQRAHSAPAGSIKRPYPYARTTKQEEPFGQDYVNERSYGNNNWIGHNGRAPKRERAGNMSFERSDSVTSMPTGHSSPRAAVAPINTEAEKNLNARLWRLTVILDLLEARWGDESLFANKKGVTSNATSFLEEQLLFNGPQSDGTELPSAGSALNSRRSSLVPPVASRAVSPAPLQLHTGVDMEAAFDAEFDAVDLDTEYDYEFYGELFREDGSSGNTRNHGQQTVAPGSFEHTFREAFGDVPSTTGAAANVVPKIPPQQEKPNTYVLDEFGRYLLMETEITNEIKRALACYGGSATGVGMTHRLKEAFIEIMNVYLGKFLLSHGMSLKEFEDLIGESMKEKSIDPVSRRPHAVSRFRMLLSQIKPRLTEEEIAMRMTPDPSVQSCIPDNLNLSGKWKYDESITVALDVIRDMQGVPWIIRKMLAGMEDEIQITQVPGKVFFQHKPKMLADGFVEYHLDGKQSPWTSSAPVPWTNPLVYTSRASFEGDHYRFEHYFSSSLRSKRLFRKSFHSDTLEVIVAIQQRNPKSMVWEDQYSARGVAFRA